MKNIVLLLLVACIAGCASTPVQTYSGPPRDKAEIAVLKGGVVNRVSGGFDYYTDLNPEGKQERIRVGNTFTAIYPQELRMSPGKYEIIMFCWQSAGLYSGFVGHPILTLDLAAGFTYDVICEIPPDNTSVFKAYVARRYPTQDLKK